MAFNDYGMYNNVFPILNPVDLGTTATNLPHVAINGAHKVAFLVQQGVTTPNATSDICDITVLAATAEGAVAQTAVTGTYRKSTGPGANTWGAVTAFTATGVELTDDDQDYSLWIEIDCADLADHDYTHLHLNVEMNAFTAFFLSATAFLDSRYRMATMKTSTACASS